LAMAEHDAIRSLAELRVVGQVLAAAGHGHRLGSVRTRMPGRGG
jgi:hypothetical protein